MKLIYRYLPFVLIVNLLTSCEKEKVESDPNQIDFSKVEVKFTAWENIDMDGDFSVEVSEDFIVIPRPPYYGKIPETVIIDSKNNSKSVLAGLNTSQDIVLTYLKTYGSSEVQQHEISFGEEYKAVSELLKPGLPSGVNENYNTVTLLFTASEGSFSTRINMDIRKYIEMGVFDEDPDFSGKGQAFFKTYLQDAFKVKHIVLKGISKEKLQANNYNTYDAIIKAFNIPD